jgi:hypothetical protein
MAPKKIVAFRPIRRAFLNPVNRLSHSENHHAAREPKYAKIFANAFILATLRRFAVLKSRSLGRLQKWKK